MAKAILEFDLSDPDDRQEHFRCLKSLDMACFIFELIRNLKKKCEYKCSEIEGEQSAYDGVEIVYEKIYELLEEHNINIDEILS